MRLTLARRSTRSRATRRASSGESLKPPRSTYSNVSRSQGRKGYSRHAASSTVSGYLRLMGMIASRCPSVEALRDMASFGRILSCASRSIPGTMPLVESVTCGAYIIQRKQITHRSVARTKALHNLRHADAEVLRQALSKCRGQVAQHRKIETPLSVERMTELEAAISRLANFLHQRA